MVNIEIRLKKRNGKIYGSFIELKENKNKVGELIFKNNKKKIYKTFYENGNLRSIVTFLDNQKHGLYKYYYQNRKIKVTIPYRFHKIHGSIKYYDEDGNLSITSSYKEGIKNGKTIHYNLNGGESITKMFRDNKLHGKVVLRSEYFYTTLYYKNGKKNGREKNYVYHSNQEKLLYNIVTYKNNVRNGNTIFFNQDEKITMIIPFRNNKIHGYKRSYHIDGSLKEKIHYCNGNPRYSFLLLKKPIECSICYEESRTQTKCFHSLCLSCYEKLNHKICPLCRNILF